MTARQDFSLLSSLLSLSLLPKTKEKKNRDDDYEAPLGEKANFT